MNIRPLALCISFAAVFASTSMAGIVGSTYHFSTSTTGSTTIIGTSGYYADPMNPGVCVGPNSDSCSSSGLDGGFTFQDVDATDSKINFTFVGSTDLANGTFTIDLGNFVTTDGSTITGITYNSGNLFVGDFTGVSWNGTDAIFTGATSSLYNAVGGRTVSFDVTLSSTPEPGTIALFGSAIAALGFARRRRLV